MTRTAGAFITHNKKILLLHRDNIPTISNPNMWETIGGIVEDGETFDEGVKREIKEETNLEPKNLKFLGKMSLADQETCRYVVRLEDSELKDIKLGNEGQELRFFSFEELDALPVGENTRHYLSKFSNPVKRLIEGEDISPTDLGLTEIT